MATACRFVISICCRASSVGWARIRFAEACGVKIREGSRPARDNRVARSPTGLSILGRVKRLKSRGTANPRLQLTGGNRFRCNSCS